MAKCLFLFLTILPYCFCILTKSDDKETTDKPLDNSLEPRVSHDKEEKKDLQAQQSVEHGHYDYEGGYGYGHGHGHHHHDHHHDHDHHDHGHGHHGGGYGGGVGGYGYGYGGGDLALKALLIPLAGAALIGAAAIFAYNPLLIQLGVVAGKKKRSVDDVDQIYKTKYTEIKQLEQFIDQLPKDQVVYQEKKLLANYLMCSGIGTGNLCLQRITCHLEHPSSNSTSLDRNVLDIVTKQIMLNEFVPEAIKKSVRRAKMIGTKSGDCRQFFCNQIDLY